MLSCMHAGVCGGRAEEIVRVLGSAWYGGRVVGLSFTLTALMQLVFPRLLPMLSASHPTSLHAPVCRHVSMCSCVSVSWFAFLSHTLACMYGSVHVHMHVSH